MAPPASSSGIPHYLQRQWSWMTNIYNKPGQEDREQAFVRPARLDLIRTRLVDLGFDAEEGEKPHLKKKAANLACKRYLRRHSPWRVGLRTIAENHFLYDEEDLEVDISPTAEELECLLDDKTIMDMLDDEESLTTALSDSKTTAYKDTENELQTSTDSLDFEMVDYEDAKDENCEDDWGMVSTPSLSNSHAAILDTKNARSVQQPASALSQKTPRTARGIFSLKSCCIEHEAKRRRRTSFALVTLNNQHQCPFSILCQDER